MKSKPIVMDHFSTVHTSYIVDFDFTNNITILTGASATGENGFIFVYKRMYGYKSRYRMHKLPGLSEGYKENARQRNW